MQLIQDSFGGGQMKRVSQALGYVCLPAALIGQMLTGSQTFAQTLHL